MMHWVNQMLFKSIIIYHIISEHLLGVLAKDLAHKSIPFLQSAGLFKFDPSDLPLHHRRQTLLNALLQHHRSARSTGSHAHSHAHQRAITTNKALRSISSGFTFPYKTTLIIENPVRKRSDHSMDIFIGPKATVLSTLIQAARVHAKEYEDKTKNPFNVSLLWDDELSCYVISQSLQIQNSTWQKWRINVKTRSKKVVYDGVCFPFDVNLRPDSVVTISYRPMSVH